MFVRHQIIPQHVVAHFLLAVEMVVNRAAVDVRHRADIRIACLVIAFFIKNPVAGVDDQLPGQRAVSVISYVLSPNSDKIQHLSKVREKRVKPVILSAFLL